MALNFGQSLGVTGNIKLTDIDLVSGGYRTLSTTADTGSIPINRLEDGQVFYASDNTFNLGSEAKSWKDLHVDGQISMGTGIDFNRNSSQLSVTGSSFNFKSTDGSDLFTLYNNSDEVSIQFDDKVLVLGETTGAPPTAVAGGMYYSGSNEWFLGYENSPT